MSSAAANAQLRRVTAASLGNEDAVTLDAAMAETRAWDRYNKYRMASRKAPVPGGDLNGTSGKAQRVLYGVYIGKGAVLMYSSGEEDQQDGGDQAVRSSAPEAPASAGRVCMVPFFAFSRPGVMVSELRGDAGSRPVHVHWYDARRPAADILRLAPRLLGPLPPDLIHQLLPQPTGAGGDAAELASHAFAAWLTGAPLPTPPPSSALAAAAAGNGGGPAAVGAGWLSGLWPLLYWVMGRKRRGGDNNGGAAAAAAAPPPPRLTLEEAWAEFERRVGEREAGMYGTSLEREWLAELGLMPPGSAPPPLASASAAEIHVAAA